MKFLGFGLDVTGELLFNPIDQKSFIAQLKREIERTRIEELEKITSKGRSIRKNSYDEIQRQGLDPGDPKSVGWAYLVHESDPYLNQIIEIMKPLAIHRGMTEPEQPLLIPTMEFEDYGDWIEQYQALPLFGSTRPRYIMMVGSPQMIPFKFQSILDVSANVGRVHFEDIRDLQIYVDKILKIEKAHSPFVDKEVLFFGTDDGIQDPTHYSLEYMVKPLNQYVSETLGFNTQSLYGYQATKKNLLAKIASSRPALVYSASHGFGYPDLSWDIKKRFNGAIQCQNDGSADWKDRILSAEDVPAKEPFMEGAVFYQFACFGYGTPAVSDYAHWLKKKGSLAKEDFIAALPAKLLANPRGPLAYVGHLDTAFLHAFADPGNPHAVDVWHARMEPFVDSVRKLLDVNPAGLSLENMNDRYNSYNARITYVYDQMRKNTYQWDDRKEKLMIQNWIIRSDAQNYMVFGDPAVALRIPNN